MGWTRGRRTGEGTRVSGNCGAEDEGRRPGRVRFRARCRPGCGDAEGPGGPDLAVDPADWSCVPRAPWGVRDNEVHRWQARRRGPGGGEVVSR